MTLAIANPELFEDATFWGYQEFKHFRSRKAPQCIFCNSEKMAVRPVTGPGYRILPATMRLPDKRMKVIPGCHLILPCRHYTDIMQMPDLWFRRLKDALVTLELTGTATNLTINNGKEAGETLADPIGHKHWWAVERDLFDEGPAKGKGLAALLVYLSQFGVVMSSQS